MSQGTIALLLGALIGGAAVVVAQIVAGRTMRRQASDAFINDLYGAMRTVVEAELEASQELQLRTRLSIAMPPENMISKLIPVGTVIPRLREPPGWRELVGRVLGADQNEYDRTSLVDLLKQHRDYVLELASTIVANEKRDRCNDLSIRLPPLEDAIRRRMDIYRWKVGSGPNVRG
jgi:hypothetical protein